MATYVQGQLIGSKRVWNIALDYVFMTGSALQSFWKETVNYFKNKEAF